MDVNRVRECWSYMDLGIVLDTCTRCKKRLEGGYYFTSCWPRYECCLKDIGVDPSDVLGDHQWLRYCAECFHNFFYIESKLIVNVCVTYLKCVLRQGAGYYKRAIN